MSNKRDNSGALFKNRKKETDQHPDLTGSALIDGVEYWLSAWNNTSDKGGKYVGLRFKRKDEQAPAPAREPPIVEEGEDLIPF